MRVTRDEKTVTWSDFNQRRRKQRDYSGLGPFVFSRETYEADVNRAFADVLGSARQS